MKEFCFEGKLLHTKENQASMASHSALEEAMKSGRVLESICYLCDSEQNLHVQLGTFEGVIPKSEGAIGAESGKVKDIAFISKVGKPVQFVITDLLRTGQSVQAVLSRKAVQQQCRESYLRYLQPGDVVQVKVTHLERFGAFVDIGAGLNSLIPIDMLSVSRIAHPAQRVREGQELCCVQRKKEDGKITLSLREMLGTWEENAAAFSAGQTVKGIVRSVESYGVFIELAPNLAGLAEYNETVLTGQAVSVYIKSIIPEKMKIKLSIIDVIEQNESTPLHYFFAGSHMDAWHYSPACCEKVIETVFNK